MNMTRYEKRMLREKMREREIAEHTMLAILGFIFVIAVFAFISTESSQATSEEILAAEQSELPIIRQIPDEADVIDISPHDTDPVSASPGIDADEILSNLSARGYVSNDTPELDAESDQFELLCQIVMDEGGYTEPEDGLRAMADGVLNRVDSPLFPDTIEGVINQKGQFQPVASGTFYKYVPTERVIRVCAQEIKKRTYPDVLFWKTGFYHANTRPLMHIGHHYYSGR